VLAICAPTLKFLPTPLPTSLYRSEKCGRAHHQFHLDQLYKLLLLVKKPDNSRPSKLSAFCTCISVKSASLRNNLQTEEKLEVKKIQNKNTHITFLRVLVWMENTLQAAIFLCQLTKVDIKCLFDTHHIKIAAFSDGRLHNPTLTEISFSDVVYVSSTLPALQSLCTAGMPTTCKHCSNNHKRHKNQNTQCALHLKYKITLTFPGRIMSVTFTWIVCQ